MCNDFNSLRDVLMNVCCDDIKKSIEIVKYYYKNARFCLDVIYVMFQRGENVQDTKEANVFIFIRNTLQIRATIEIRKILEISKGNKISNIDSIIKYIESGVKTDDGEMLVKKWKKVFKYRVGFLKEVRDNLVHSFLLDEVCIPSWDKLNRYLKICAYFIEKSELIINKNGLGVCLLQPNGIEVINGFFNKI